MATDPNVAIAWDIRNAVCGHNACAASDAANGKHYCEISTPFGNGQVVTLQRYDKSGNFKNCYGATENIINQCFQAQGSFTEKSPSGNWKIPYNNPDEWYWITMNYTSVPDPAEEFLVENGYIDLKETLYGPTQFCQGLSPGGGDSCINIPDGCRIQVPIDNTIPKVDCSPLHADA